MVMVFMGKSIEVTVSEITSTDASEYHSLFRRSTLSTSGMRALDSFVRSIGRFGSFPISVILPLYPDTRSDWTTPKVPEPLQTPYS